MGVTEKINQAEKNFQECLLEWTSNNNKQSWDKLWRYVYDCCHNICLKNAKNKYIPELDEKILDATIYCMEQIKNGARPEKLSSWCYMRCIKYLLDKKTQFWERNIVLETDLEKEYER